MNVSSRLREGETMSADGDLGALFHRLNNELGIVLAHAELLEHKVADEGLRARVEQVVTSVLDAMGTAREIRRHTEAAGM